MNEFQPVVGYREPAKSPFVVTTQTNRFLELFRTGLIFDLTLGEEYLKEYTLGYIANAESSCALIFDRSGKSVDTVDIESREAVSHAYTVFSWLPDMTVIPSIPALKNGFARNGMLKAPISREEFLMRTRELKIELAKIATGITTYKQRPKLGSSLFRTLTFFRVAEYLNPSFQLSVQEREIINRQKDIKLIFDKYSASEVS